MPDGLASDQGAEEWNSAFQLWEAPWATYKYEMWEIVPTSPFASIDMGHLWVRDLCSLGVSSELKLEIKQHTSLRFIRGEKSGLGLGGGGHIAVFRKVGEVRLLCAWYSAPLPAQHCSAVWTPLLFQGRWESGIFLNWRELELTAFHTLYTSSLPHPIISISLLLKGLLSFLH